MHRLSHNLTIKALPGKIYKNLTLTYKQNGQNKRYPCHFIYSVYTAEHVANILSSKGEVMGHNDLSFIFVVLRNLCRLQT